jgi:hypothetical protein
MTGDSQVGRKLATPTDEPSTGERRSESTFSPPEYQGRNSYTREAAATGSPNSRFDTGIASQGGDRRDLLIPPAPYPRGASDVASSRLEVTAPTSPGGQPTEKTIVQSPGALLPAGDRPSIEIRQPADQQAAGAGARGGGSAETSNQPFTFRVSSEGKVLDSIGHEVAKELAFANGVPKNIVIQMDRASNVQEAAQQQAKLGDFVQTVLNPALRQAGVNGDAVSRSDATARPENRAAAEARADVPEPVVSPQEHFSRPERHVSHHVNGRHGMPNDHHGSMPRRMADSMFPEGDSRRPGDHAENVARREMMAATFNPDKENPHATIREQPDGHSYAVGRYGHSYNHFNNMMHRAVGEAMHHWPKEIADQLGHPPDWSKLSQILKEHPELMKGIQDNVAEQVKNKELAPELAAKFQNAETLGNFGNFVNKLRGDSGAPTKEELAKNFDRPTQDAMARDTVDRDIRGGKSPAETALAHHLGVDSSQLTDQQKTDPANREFMESAGKLHALATARQTDGPSGSRNPDDRINWMTDHKGDSQARVSDIPHELGKQMASWAKNWAERNPETHDARGIGNCTRLARMLYDTMGVMHLPGMSGVEQGRFMMQSGLFRQVDKHEAREGDFAFRGWAHRRSPTSGRNLGDSLIVTGNHGGNVYGVNGASNHEFAVNTRGGYYTPEIYLRPTDAFLEKMKQRGS